VFCQNRQISRERMGRAVGTDEFAGICLALQHAGAENINLVTGTHAAPALRLGVERARARGLRIPVCWNSSAYEAPASLAEAEAFADWYLPDLKTLDPRIAGRLFGAPDYPQAARDAVLRMTQARPGRVIVRHLILPGLLDSTREVLRWFAERLAGRALLSLMTQYTPVSGIDAGAPPRPLSPAEYDQALTWLSEFGIEEGFCQERPSGAPDRDWLPDFSRPNPFPSSLSTPVWHWGQ
jgi:putative pyruvate formate lyase activating enzyme